MLRELDARGGVSVYAHNLTRELLELDRRNHYVLLYRDSRHVGRFGRRDNVTERVLRVPSAPVAVGRYTLNPWDPFWDQIVLYERIGGRLEGRAILGARFGPMPR